MELLINSCETSIIERTLRSGSEERKGYRKSTLGEMTELISRGISPTYSETANTIVLNQRCIRNGQVDLNFSRRHDEKSKKVQTVKFLKNGDGLVNSTGVGTLGRTAFFDHPGVGDFTVDSHVTIVRPKIDLLDSDFFGLVLSALENTFVSLSTGTSGQTELPRNAISDTVIHFPMDISEQKKSFLYYNSLKVKISVLRENLNGKRMLTGSLRTSILNSAFATTDEMI
jgi:type I restriction enzyme S subunit